MKLVLEIIVAAMFAFMTMYWIAVLTYDLWVIREYLWIIIGGAVFTGIVFLFDRFAEEQGLITHHWWD